MQRYAWDVCGDSLWRLPSRTIGFCHHMPCSSIVLRTDHGTVGTLISLKHTHLAIIDTAGQLPIQRWRKKMTHCAKYPELEVPHCLKL